MALTSYEATLLALDTYKYLYYLQGDEISADMVKLRTNISQYIKEKNPNFAINEKEQEYLKKLYRTFPDLKINFYERSSKPSELASLSDASVKMSQLINNPPPPDKQYPRIYLTRLINKTPPVIRAFLNRHLLKSLPKNPIRKSRPYKMDPEHALQRFNTIIISLQYPRIYLTRLINKTSRVIRLFLYLVCLPLLILSTIPHLVISTILSPFIQGRLFKWSTVDYGNIPYQSNKFVTDKNEILEMGMPLEIKNRLLFSSVEIKPEFKDYIKTRYNAKEPFLYICLLEEKPAESQYIDCLKSFSENSNDAFKFIAIPPQEKIEALEKEISAKVEKVDSIIMRKLLIKELQPNGKYYKIPPEIFNKISQIVQYQNPIFEQPVDIKKAITQFNAEIVQACKEVYNPKMRSYVCKDGIDRGHSTGMVIEAILKQNNEISFTEEQIASRATTVKGRPMNSHNKKLIEENKFSIESSIKTIPTNEKSLALSSNDCKKEKPSFPKKRRRSSRQVTPKNDPGSPKRII